MEARWPQRHDDTYSRLCEDRKQLEHRARLQIRRQSLDSYSRIHSIAEDTLFVARVHHKYGSFPMLPNLRCGAWYCDPSFSTRRFAHFKSADGHYNGWAFNLRRPNLHLLPLIREAHGLALVDSTRSGKRMPDSFAKTVPIWCAVINRALCTRNRSTPEAWDNELHTPPQSVSQQENAQIEARIDGWTNSLAMSSFDIPALEKPLRPIWITPATTVLPSFDLDTPFFPIICVSASKVVEEGIERRREGYTYVQGAGDDHEFWSSGLTPEMFWAQKEELLSAREDEFLDVLLRLIEKPEVSASEQIERTTLPTSIARIGERLLVAAHADLPSSHYERGAFITDPDCRLPCIFLHTGSPAVPEQPRSSSSETDAETSTPFLEIHIRGDKKSAERAFKACLPRCLDFIRRHLEEGRNVCVACETGKDLSIGVVIAAMQVFFADDGSLDLGQGEEKRMRADKDSIRTRLHWIIASRPEANPSRATLKRINEFFMSPAFSRR